MLLQGGVLAFSVSRRTLSPLGWPPSPLYCTGPLQSESLESVYLLPIAELCCSTALLLHAPINHYYQLRPFHGQRAFQCLCSSGSPGLQNHPCVFKTCMLNLHSQFCCLTCMINSITSVWSAHFVLMCMGMYTACRFSGGNEKTWVMIPSP